MSVAVSRGADFWDEDHAPYLGIDEEDPPNLVATGPELRGIVVAAAKLLRDFHRPASRQKETVAEAFARLAAEWRSETAFLSSTEEMSMHPSYQRIIGLGAEVVPLLLRELATELEHWFWALNSITGVDPVPAEERGHVEKMREAWLRWGRLQGWDLP